MYLFNRIDNSRNCQHHSTFCIDKIATIGRIGVMVAGYMGSIPLMLVFTALSTLGIAPLQGDLNALIASCSEYTTLTTGHRLDGMMYSCSSLGIKIGGAL